MILLLEVRTESAQAVKTLPMHCDVHQALSRVAADPEGRHFQAAMQAQLNKINDFYRAKELQLEVRSVASLNAACFWEGCKVSPKSAGVGDPETPGEARRSGLDCVQGRLRRPAQIRCGMCQRKRILPEHKAPRWQNGMRRMAHLPMRCCS